MDPAGSRAEYSASPAHGTGKLFCVVFGSLWHCPPMVLTHGELESLVHVRHRSPHTQLGMHPVGDGAGMVVRAVVPVAALVDIEPTHEEK
jgi:hypothetical protein